jgi:hypothetical protein
MSWLHGKDSVVLSSAPLPLSQKQVRSDGVAVQAGQVFA